jgi:hypothetical protein
MWAISGWLNDVWTKIVFLKEDHTAAQLDQWQTIPNKLPKLWYSLAQRLLSSIASPYTDPINGL